MAYTEGQKSIIRPIEGPVVSSEPETAGGYRLPEEEALVRKAFEQDAREGVEMLFRMYYAPLCSYAARIVYSKAVAEDLVSELFYQFYVRELYKAVNSSFKAYLMRAVQSRGYNYLQREARRATDLDHAEELGNPAGQDPDSIVEYEELFQSYEKSIGELPAQCRKIFLMHRFEGMKYQEIADKLEISPRTVEVQIRKASHYIRKALADRRDWLISLLIGLLAQNFL